MGTLVVAALRDGEEGEPLGAPGGPLPPAGSPDPQLPRSDATRISRKTPLRCDPATKGEVTSVRVPSAAAKARGKGNRRGVLAVGMGEIEGLGVFSVIPFGGEIIRGKEGKKPYA